MFPDEMLNMLIDCDPGIDDALAIFMVLNFLKNSNLNTLPSITTTGGNATIEDTTKNTCLLLDFYKKQSMSSLEIDNVKIGIGADRPIEGRFQYAYEFHGKHGLGIDLSKYNSERPTIPAKNIFSSNDFKKIEVLAIGPLTNIAIAIKNNPLFRKSISSITIMGGSINGKGNVTPFAEFNIYNDPVAAEYIFRSEIPTTLIPLDITEKVYVSKFEMPWLQQNSNIAKFTNELISSWFNQDSIHRTQFHFHDPVAVVAYLAPDFFCFEEVSIEVDCSSSKFRGQTELSSKKGNTKLAVDIDSSKTKRMIYELLNNYQ